MVSQAVKDFALIAGQNDVFVFDRSEAVLDSVVGAVGARGICR